MAAAAVAAAVAAVWEVSGVEGVVVERGGAGARIGSVDNAGDAEGAGGGGGAGARVGSTVRCVSDDGAILNRDDDVVENHKIVCFDAMKIKRRIRKPGLYATEAR